MKLEYFEIFSLDMNINLYSFMILNTVNVYNINSSLLYNINPKHFQTTK